MFGLTVFLGAFLGFWIQPLYTKMALPFLGGSPSVWNASVLFFQTMLFVGYLFVHVCSRYLTLRRQLIAQFFLYAGALSLLPFSITADWIPSQQQPVASYLALLTISIGLPFLAVSSTAPLVQRWYFHAGQSRSEHPYFLYAWSNAGALIALLGYPFILEPAFGIKAQSYGWMVLFALLAVLIAGVGMSAVRPQKTSINLPATESKKALFNADQISWRQRLLWLALTFIPSALLLAVTLHISTDIASTPFLWVIPLSIYLGTFILTFARHPLMTLEWTQVLQVWIYIGIGFYFYIDNVLWLFGIHLAALFITGMVCHARLIKTAPRAEYLTEFYFWISLGGLLGGIFSVLLAPNLFSRVLEYPLLIILACFLRLPRPSVGRRQTLLDYGLPAIFLLFLLSRPYAHWLPITASQPLTDLVFYTAIAAMLYLFKNRRVRFGLAMAALILINQVKGVDDVIFRDRSFFGVYSVEASADSAVRLLYHGSTIHGAQAIRADNAMEPLTYYNRAGPVGQFMRAFSNPGSGKVVTAVGLGTGAISCYFDPPSQLSFVEIDPVIVDIATNDNYFSYMSRCGQGAGITIGDGRKVIETLADNSVDLIILDAFSSDAIPIHLLTEEAFKNYFAKLTDQGYLLVHLTNRNINLEPVVARLAEHLDYSGLINNYQPNEMEFRLGGFESSWAVLARSSVPIDNLGLGNGWVKLAYSKEDSLWTDDYSNVIRYVDWKKILW